MTSDRSDGCFVYITLPGSTHPVTAGRFELSVDRRGTPIGRFVYGRRYLARADAVPIDPVELRLADRTYETAAQKGVFGALRDAGPDYWGRRVIERHAGKAELSELDYLLLSPDDRAGALGFGRNTDPPAPLLAFNRTLDLKKLQEIADQVADADRDGPRHETAIQVQELLLVGTSMGGARPKAVVEDEDGLWLAKFNRPDDKWNHARVEHAMLGLARSCGMTTAESRVVSVADRDVLLVKRFDRHKVHDGYTRARMVSALTLLRADDTQQSRERWSYLLLVEELRRASASAAQDATELFRRMCFNALISNTDDHPRNHALLATGLHWRLSPAYDLTPSMPVSIERRDLALTVGDAGRFASAENLLSQCARFLLERDQARAIVDEMEGEVASLWYEVARRVGVTERDCATIAPAFAYSGFRLPMRST
ncbi:MAG: type II toxin-antitoxin system HipA family toxin [Deltaproteobacteria bacterium]|nr:type II toxin-antitoxin system HipA family toxin [Deltaproteobacteria bacterium]